MTRYSAVKEYRNVTYHPGRKLSRYVERPKELSERRGQESRRKFGNHDRDMPMVSPLGFQKGFSEIFGLALVPALYLIRRAA